MGLVNFLKNIFSKPLKVSLNASNDVITLVSKGAKIKIGKKLVVPKGFVCFLVAKEKVLDRYVEGTYHLTINEIPALSRELKLNIPNKKNKYKQTFKADVYFVNLKDFENQNFASEKGIYIKKDKQFLGTTVYVDGKYSYKIKDPQLFLDCLLKVYGVVNGSLAQRRLDIFTGELVDKKIQKNKPSLEELYERNTNCFLGLVDYLNSNMSDVGIEYSSAEVLNVDMPNKIYKQVELSFKEKRQSEEKFEPLLQGKQTNTWYKKEPEISTVNETIGIDNNSFKQIEIDNLSTEIKDGVSVAQIESSGSLNQINYNEKERLKLEKEYFDNLDASNNFGFVDEDNTEQNLAEKKENNQQEVNVQSNISSNQDNIHKSMFDFENEIKSFGENEQIITQTMLKCESIENNLQYDNEQSKKTIEQSKSSSQNVQYNVNQSNVFETNGHIQSNENNANFDNNVNVENQQNYENYSNQSNFENKESHENDTNAEKTVNYENNFYVKNKQDIENKIDEIPEPTESLEQLQKKVSYKKCSHCGAINSKSSNICFNCKNEFKKICQNCKTEINNGDFVCPKCKSIVI